MLPTKIQIRKGEMREMTFLVQLPVDPTAEVVEYEPFDLTGMDLEFKVINKNEGTEFTKEVADGIEVFDQVATPGQGRITIETADTEDLQTGAYSYTFWIIDGSDRIPLCARLPFEILPP